MFSHIVHGTAYGHTIARLFVFTIGANRSNVTQGIGNRHSSGIIQLTTGLIHIIENITIRLYIFSTVVIVQSGNIFCF